MAVPVYSVSDSAGRLLELLDSDGHHYYDPPGTWHHTDPLTDVERTQVAAQEAWAVVDSARRALSAALDLMASGPLDDAGRGQVDAALTQYRGLPPIPPADVVDLANRVSTHIQSNGYARAVEARTAQMPAEMRFVTDETISHKQLVEHVRELTRQVWALRSGA